MEYELISDIESSKSIVQKLWKQKVIGLDCEGYNLGRKGTLSIIQISTVDSNIYIFDTQVQENQKDFLEKGGLKEILESELIIKVIHDCRRDSDALYHHGNVKLKSVFDTQIAFAHYKQGKYTPKPIGLNKLLSSTLKCENSFKSDFHSKMNTDNTFWTTRPLDRNKLLYASEDVLFLLKLYKEQLLLLKNKIQKVFEHSEIYVSILRDCEDPEKKKKRNI